VTEDAHEVRRLKYLLKQANKERGKQGEIIFALRGEVALLRERIRALQSIDRLQRNRDTMEKLEEAHRKMDQAAPMNPNEMCRLEPSKIEGLV
jgi:tetrahydrodipicolinate N-succinyltransferase